MVSTSAKKLINIATFIMLFHYFFHLILISSLHCQSFLRISGITKIRNKKITFQCKIFIVPEEGWFGQPKYSTHIKTFLRCAGFCLCFLQFSPPHPDKVKNSPGAENNQMPEVWPGGGEAGDVEVSI